MRATVIKSTGSHYRVLSEEGELVDVRLRGKIRLKGDRHTNPVAVGDRVELDEASEVITEILPRDNHLIRRSTNLSKESHIIAANVDQIVLVCTLDRPVTSTGFIDRVLVTAEAYHIPVVILFNKTDLLDSSGKERLAQLESVYQAIGYTTYSASLQQAKAEKWTPLFQDKVTLLTGHSGVGKSTLTNLIQPGLQLETAEVSDAYNKGKHTTTFAEMHPLDLGGFIVDTPGIKGFGMVDMDESLLSHYFPEMRVLLDRCKFNNCQHMAEPGCAVKQAYAAGQIAESRYDSYLQLYAGDEGRYRKDPYA